MVWGRQSKGLGNDRGLLFTRGISSELLACISRGIYLRLGRGSNIAARGFFGSYSQRACAVLWLCFSFPRVIPYELGVQMSDYEGSAFEKTPLFCIFVKFAT